MAWIQDVTHRHAWSLDPSTILKVMESLGGGIWLAEVGHEGHVFKDYNNHPSLQPVFSAPWSTPCEQPLTDGPHRHTFPTIMDWVLSQTMSQIKPLLLSADSVSYDVTAQDKWLAYPQLKRLPLYQKLQWKPPQQKQGAQSQCPMESRSKPQKYIILTL